MLQNMLDSIQKKNFRSTSYDKNSIKARGEIFDKNKLTGEVRYAPAMRKLATAGRQQKKKTQVEQKFLPYDNKKTHYGLNSLADAGISNVLEWG